MVSDLFLNAVAPMATTFGINATALVYLLAFSISLMITLAVATTVKKELGLPTFFLSLLFMTLVGAFDWFVLVLPLILIGVWYFKREGN